MPARSGPPPIEIDAGVCRVVVYLEPHQLSWLRKVESDSLVSGRRLGSSAVVRLALGELMKKRPNHADLQRRVKAG